MMLCSRLNRLPGSLEGRCSDCSSSVWIAPSGQELMDEAEEGVVVVCVSCGLERMAADPAPQMLPLTIAQRLELEAWRRRQ